jgi:hypothetical protein
MADDTNKVVDDGHSSYLSSTLDDQQGDPSVVDNTDLEKIADQVSQEASEDDTEEVSLSSYGEDDADESNADAEHVVGSVDEDTE